MKHLVELHGGSISARSEGLGKGASFCVTLPMRRRLRNRVGRARAIEPTDERSHLRGRRLLVIDDEADTRSYLQRLLSERGASVSVAATVEEGLRCAREGTPDAIICDISMPGEDGYSFIRRLRASEAAELRAIPVAALTAMARAEDRDRALAAGFDEHCTKPVDPAEVRMLLGRLLEVTP